jgi:hypothetical protein
VGSHHLPPCSILYASPRGPHPNGFLSQDSQVGVPKLPKLKLSWLRSLITLCANLWLKWGLKQSCSPCQEISNDILHATYTQGNRVDYRLLMLKSQTINLTPGLSFGHNLCFRWPNGSCEPILYIYVLIAFQWYKELLEPLGLTLAITLWTFANPLGFHFPKWKLLWECEGSFPHTFLHFRASLLAHNLANFYFGREPKAKVATPSNTLKKHSIGSRVANNIRNLGASSIMAKLVGSLTFDSTFTY